jgi:hypothetical protein
VEPLVKPAAEKTEAADLCDVLGLFVHDLNNHLLALRGYAGFVSDEVVRSGSAPRATAELGLLESAIEDCAACVVGFSTGLRGVEPDADTLAVIRQLRQALRPGVSGA